MTAVGGRGLAVCVVLGPQPRAYLWGACRPRDVKPLARLATCVIHETRQTFPLVPSPPRTHTCPAPPAPNSRALALSADAINGPTTSGGQRPFAWADHPRFERIPHRGMLEVFDTAWEEQAP